MSRLVGLALAVVLVGLAGCSTSAPAPVTQATATPTPTTVAVPVVQPTVNRAAAERAFLDAAEDNYIDISDVDLLLVGHSTCTGWDNGVNYQQTRDLMDRHLLSWSESDKDTVVILSALYLCPQHAGKYGG